MLRLLISILQKIGREETIQFGFKHYPNLDRDGHIARAIAHLHEKYGRGGYLKLWIPWSENAVRLNALQDIIADPDVLLLRLQQAYLCLHED